MAYNLIGKNFVPHDVVAKVTGRAKYAEDFRAEGMVFCKLLTSPMPHAKIRSIDASEALKMPGVLGILTADDVPQFPPPSRRSSPRTRSSTSATRSSRWRPRREHRGGRARRDQDRLRATAARARPARQPAIPADRSAVQRQCRGRADQPADRQVGGRGLRCGRRRQAADGQACRRMELRRSRCRLQGMRSWSSRKASSSAGYSPSLHGAALRHGLLAGRQVLPVRLEPEPHRGGAQHRPLIGIEPEGPRVCRRISAAAASAARSPAIRIMAIAGAACRRRSIVR